MCKVYGSKGYSINKSNKWLRLYFYQSIAKMKLEEHVDIPDEPHFSTNEVLKEETKKKTTYFLPCYVRFKVKELLSIDIGGLQATVSGTLLFSFYYGKLDRAIVDQFVGEDAKKGILLQFSRQESILLQEEKGITLKEDEKEKQIDFVIRQDFTCYLIGDVFLTPFEVINLYLTITLQTIPLNPKENDGKKIEIKFNCMNNENAMPISHGDKCSLGLYSLATYFIAAKYTNKDKNPYKKISVMNPGEKEDGGSKKPPKVRDLNDSMNTSKKSLTMGQPVPQSQKQLKPEKDDKKVKHFQYTHFRAPVYKHPGISLMEIFIPLWILGFINLIVFFQDNYLVDKISIISTLALAYIAFIPTINEAVPKTPEIKLIDFIIYVEILTTVLTIIDSLRTVQTKPLDFVFVWDDSVLFIITLVINLISVLIVLILFFTHKLFWERVYTGIISEEGKDKGFIRKNWYNKDCDKEFEKSIKSGKVVVVE